MTIDISALMASIRAGEDTTLELKEVAFRGHGVQLGSDGTRPAARLAEVFASMANTEGGIVVLGVRDDGVPTGIESDKRGLVEQLVINAATENCEPMIVPRLDWEYLPRDDGDSRLCLIIGIPASTYEVHQTADGRYLQRIGSHCRPIPVPTSTSCSTGMTKRTATLRTENASSGRCRSRSSRRSPGSAPRL